MDIQHTFSFWLGIVGIVGTLILLGMTATVFWQYWDCPLNSFRWRLRNVQLKQVAALACLFFLAMTASYAVLLEAWAILYLIIACKIATWWLRLALAQRA